jgi:hypothetical protein
MLVLMMAIMCGAGLLYAEALFRCKAAAAALTGAADLPCSFERTSGPEFA